MGEQLVLLNKNLGDFSKALTQYNENFKKSSGINGFAEPENHDGFGMSLNPQGLFKISGNGLVIAFGVALSSAVSGLFSKFIPVGNSGIVKVIAAIVVKKLLKLGGIIGDFFDGVMLAGISEVVGGFTSGIKLFGEPRPSVGANIPSSYNSPVFMQPPAPFAGVKYY